MDPFPIAKAARMGYNSLGDRNVCKNKCDLKDGLSGLVHISQICQKRIKKPSEVLKVGDKVKVKVLNTNEGKISLSIKAVEEDQTAQEIEELDTKQFTEGESVGTNLGDLFKKLGF